MARGAPGEETYTPQVQPEDLPRKIIPRMEAVPVGQAFEQVAEAVTRKHQADSATWAADQITQARVKAVSDLEAAKANAPEGDQTGFTQKFLAGFDKSNQDLAESAGGNPLARQMVERGLTDLRQTLQTHTQQWEATQNVAYRETSVRNNTTASLALVEAHPELGTQVGATLTDQIDMLGGDPSRREALKREIYPQLALAEANGLTRQDPRGALKALNDPANAPAAFKPVVNGLNDQQREAVRQKANEELTKPIYTQLEDNDFAGAQKSLYASRDLMDPKTVYSMQNIIDAKSKEKANENKQDIADRYQDSLAAAQYAIPHAVTVTRAEMDVLHPKDGQRYWDALQGIVEAGAKAQQYNQMTPEQMAADRDASYPTSGGPETALKIKAYEIRASAMDQSIKARNADPAQFAQDAGLGWKPLDLSKPEDVLTQLRTRANSQGQISEQTGVNTPLLSKTETKQFTGWLAAQPASDRLQSLTTLRSTMPNDQAYSALMKQIAPESPLTAIAGAMLDKPATGATPNWNNPAFATSPVVPQRVLEGQDILRSKDEKGIASKFPMPSDKDLQSAFQEAIGGASSDLFRGRSETLESYWAAYKAAYAAEANHQGVSNGVINSTIAQAAAHGVIGHAATYGSTAVVVPAGMDPTRFEGIVNTASSAALKSAGYSDSDVAALRGHGLRELGDTLGTGRYVIINGNGDALKSKDGKKTVVLDLNQQFQGQHALTATETPHTPVSQSGLSERMVD